MTIRREYYPIADAAKMIGCTVADLIHLGANWMLDIYATFDHDIRAWLRKSHDDDAPVLTQLSYGLHLLNPIEIEMLESGRKDWLSNVHLGKSSYQLLKNGNEYIVPSEMFIMTVDIEELSENGTTLPQPIASIVTEPKITGATFARLQAVLEAFDPNNPPRSKKAFMGKIEALECDTREQEVFANIAAEHFGHSWRT